ncbi:DUF397 domain-containing protein [Streptomyces sp. NPDC015171]|uniref:DUF397 domain-containing protein n=1 Tax=Streptomyces sp. NPDC015171 TaxID=3364945 RepID=UPI0036FBA676
MLSADTWRRSSFSGGGQGDACVEVAARRTRISVRDSKAPDRATLTFPASAFVAFLDALRADSRSIGSTAGRATSSRG